MRVGIIGAGITGSYLAWKLAEAGHDVMVFEKKPKTGKEACSGLISKRVWNFIPKKKELIEHVIDKAVIHFPKKKIELTFSPEMHVIDRPALDRYVAEIAASKGAKFFYNYEFKKLFHYVGHKPQISMAAEKGSVAMEFDKIIGCDGALSALRKQMRKKDPQYRLGLEFYQNKKNESKSVDIWPMGQGFAWRIPRGGRVEYGILDDPKNAKKNFDRFCRRLKIKKQSVFSAVVPRGLVLSDRMDVALVGDAAGMTKPWSGGGVIWGLTAADMLIKSFPNFKKYHRKADRFYSPKIFYSGIIEKIGIFIGNNIPILVPKKLEIDSDWVF